MLLPICFIVITVLVLYTILTPIITPYWGLAQLVLSSENEAPPSELFTQLSDNIKNVSAEILLSDFVYPEKGDKFGEIVIEDADVEVPIYYGDSDAELNKGVGLYVDNSGAGIPGESKTILAAGHTVTHFHNLKNAEVGQIVSVNTHYGTYEYKITETKITTNTDDTAYDFTRTDENLIMYCCYPFNRAMTTPDRFFVYAEYLSGPKIVEN